MNINPALYWHSVYTSGMWELADWITLGVGIAILGFLWNLLRQLLIFVNAWRSSKGCSKGTKCETASTE